MYNMYMNNVYVYVNFMGIYNMEECARPRRLVDNARQIDDSIEF